MKTPKNLVGKSFGKLVVTEIFFKKVGTKNRKFCICKCVCGNIVERRVDYLMSGKCIHCGCMHQRYKNITGNIYGRLIVKGFRLDKEAGKRYRRIWICECKCGNVIEVKRPDALKCGYIKSCGCLSKETIKTAIEKIKLPEGEAAFNILFNEYKARAIKNNTPFKLKRKKFKLIIKESCYYCGSEPDHEYYYKTNGILIYNGIDRVDNTKGYTTNNCVPCCKTCNYMKGSLLIKEFFKHVKTIYRFQKSGKQIHTKIEKFNDKIAMNIVMWEYKKNAHNKKIPFKLNNDIFYDLTKSCCSYCGTKPCNIRFTQNKKRKYTFNGIDRVNNDKGYTKNNCVACCSKCNYMKRDYKKDLFLSHVEKVYIKHRNL